MAKTLDLNHVAEGPVIFRCQRDTSSEELREGRGFVLAR